MGCGYKAGYLRIIQSRLAKGVGVGASIAEECDGIPKLEFVRGPVSAVLPRLTEISFDLVLFISVLRHLKDPPEASKQREGMLKPGGLSMINAPHGS